MSSPLPTPARKLQRHDVLPGSAVFDPGMRPGTSSTYNTNSYNLPPLPPIPGATVQELQYLYETLNQTINNIFGSESGLGVGIIRTNDDLLEYWTGTAWANFGDSLGTSDPGGGKVWLSDA